MERDWRPHHASCYKEQNINKTTGHETLNLKSCHSGTQNTKLISHTCDLNYFFWHLSCLKHKVSLCTIPPFTFGVSPVWISHTHEPSFSISPKFSIENTRQYGRCQYHPAPYNHSPLSSDLSIFLGFAISNYCLAFYSFFLFYWCSCCSSEFCFVTFNVVGPICLAWDCGSEIMSATFKFPEEPGCGSDGTFC